MFLRFIYSKLIIFSFVIEFILARVKKIYINYNIYIKAVNLTCFFNIKIFTYKLIAFGNLIDSLGALVKKIGLGAVGPNTQWIVKPQV